MRKDFVTHKGPQNPVTLAFASARCPVAGGIFVRELATLFAQAVLSNSASICSFVIFLGTPLLPQPNTV